MLDAIVEQTCPRRMRSIICDVFRHLNIPSEIKKFQSDLLASVKQMKRGEAARISKVTITAAVEARARVGLSQHEFADLLGVSVRTLRDWELGRREPNGAAKTLFRVAVAHPEVLRELFVSARS